MDPFIDLICFGQREQELVEWSIMGDSLFDISLANSAIRSTETRLFSSLWKYRSWKMTEMRLRIQIETTIRVAYP